MSNAVLECVSSLTQWYERNSQTAQIALCSVSDRFLIPARSEAHVKCRLQSDHAHKLISSTRTSSDAAVGLVEPYVGFASIKSVLIASSFVALDGNETHLRVLNPTCNSVTLFPSQTIAQHSHFNENELQAAVLNAINVSSANKLMKKI